MLILFFTATEKGNRQSRSLCQARERGRERHRSQSGRHVTSCRTVCFYIREGPSDVGSRRPSCGPEFNYSRRERGEALARTPAVAPVTRSTHTITAGPFCFQGSAFCLPRRPEQKRRMRMEPRGLPQARPHRPGGVPGLLSTQGPASEAVGGPGLTEGRSSLPVPHRTSSLCTGAVKGQLCGKDTCCRAHCKGKGTGAQFCTWRWGKAASQDLLTVGAPRSTAVHLLTQAQGRADGDLREWSQGQTRLASD
jgi:hypothetical protein